MTILLVRHAHAGHRRDWDGADRERPLSDKGVRQAAALVGALSDFRVERVLSSPWLRCVQTVEPLAAHLNLEVDHARELGEASGSREPVQLLRKLWTDGGNAVVCSHGDVIPEVLTALAWEDGLSLPAEAKCAKGSTWVLGADTSGRFVSARYLAPGA